MYMTFEEILDEENIMQKIGSFAVNKIADKYNSNYDELIGRYYKVLPARSKQLFRAHMKSYREALIKKNHTTAEALKHNPILFHKVQSEYFDEALRRISKDYGELIEKKMSKFRHLMG